MTESRPVPKVIQQHIQCRPPPFCRSRDTYVVLMAFKLSKYVNKEKLEPKKKSSKPGKNCRWPSESMVEAMEEVKKGRPWYYCETRLLILTTH